MHAERYLEKKKTKKISQLLALFILVVGIPALWYWWSLSTNRFQASPASSLSGVPEISLNQASSESEGASPFVPSRGPEIFPYSVIPGGVRSARDLQEAVRHEALVAQHYSGFDLASAHVIHAVKGKEVYVSYRIGNQIFWTRRKVAIHAGETLLTDGHNFVRGRCGNRISESPKSPASPAEPSDFAMSAPVVFPDPALLGLLDGDVPNPLILLPPQTSFPPSANIPPGGSFPPIFPPLFAGPGSSSNPLPPAVPPVVSTSEPDSLLLVVLGLAFLAFLAFLRFRRIV